MDNADLEREQIGLKREEQKLIREIKQAAAKNNTPTVRVLAKSLVRLRGQQARLAASAAQMRGVSSSMVVSHHAHQSLASDLCIINGFCDSRLHGGF